MNLQLQELYEARKVPQWLYRQSLMMMLVARIGLALVFAILFLAVLLIG
jgi:hypothetical protein